MAAAPPSKGGSASATLISSAVSLASLQNIKTLIFWLTIRRIWLQFYRHLRAKGLTLAVQEAYTSLIRRLLGIMMLVPSVRRKVSLELDRATLDLEATLAKKDVSCPPQPSLPPMGLAPAELTARLRALNSLPKTSWESGKVSGAVYHGGADLSAVWNEAFALFGVSNPLHPDVFPGVRQMESDVVQMVLNLFNAPVGAGVLDRKGGAGTTTSGGTESILMACKAYRDRARALKGITEPEMVIPNSAHAAFEKAGAFFGIKVRKIPVDPLTRKVVISKVRRAINANTILLVGSAPNYPDGMIDDIPALSDLALRHGLGLHVDCCLGSFLVPFLELAGFPTEPFDFRVPGVTSISCDTHKYGFAPKGSSVIMYRDKDLRKYQFEITTDWPGGVYGSPSMSGSRPGALIAGAWASLLFMGEAGYVDSCRAIVGARRAIETAIRKDFPELYILGKPMVSVVAFGSEVLPIYEVGDRLSKAGWHLNALQTPPALHMACTRLTIDAVPSFLAALRAAVDATAASSTAQAGAEEEKKGSMVTIYGLGSSSAVGPGLVREMASRYMDVLYS